MFFFHSRLTHEFWCGYCAFIHFLINCKGSKTVPLDDCEMKETYDRSEMISSQYVPCTKSQQQQQLLFGNLTSFVPNQLHQQQWPTINDDVRAKSYAVDWLGENPVDNGFDINDVIIVPPLKSDMDQTNNNCTTANKQLPSFFQLAKEFCGNIRNMSMFNVDCVDEITRQLARLRFAPC